MNSTKTVSHTAIYAMGNILGNIASIVMLPIYTRYLTPEDYGVVELLSMTLDAIGILIGMRLGQAIFRYYTHAENKRNANEIISTALWISVALNSIAFLALFVFSQPISELVFGNNTHEHLLVLFAITLICQALIEVPKIYLRAEEKPWTFFFFGLLKLALQISFNIYFVVIKDMHVTGVVYSALISSIIMSVLLTGYTVLRTNIRFSMSIARSMVIFSIPLMLTTIGSFVMTYGDRYFLRIYSSLSEVGIYSLAYKFGFILVIITWDPISKVWDKMRYDVYRQPDAIATYQKVFMYVNLLIITVGTGIALFSKDLLNVMSAPEFHSAAPIVPVVLVAYLIFCMTNYCNTGLLIKERTIHFAYAEGVAVVVILLAYLTLIPRYGGMGAAYATVLGFTARLIWTNIASSHYYDMKLPWKRVIAMLSLSALAYLICQLAPDQIILSIIFRIVVMLSFIASLYFLPILSTDEKKEIIGMVLAIAKINKKPKPQTKSQIQGVKGNREDYK